jgi:hypothetical protein
MFLYSKASVVHPASYPMGARGSSPGSKATATQNWSVPSNRCLDSECVELHLYIRYTLSQVYISYTTYIFKLFRELTS